jgi:ADP-ribosylglycohydrolase
LLLLFDKSGRLVSRLAEKQVTFFDNPSEIPNKIYSLRHTWSQNRMLNASGKYPSFHKKLFTVNHNGGLMKSAAQAMVLASFVADSLALGIHWIYDTEQIDRQVGRITNLLSPSENGYHPTKKRGEFTHYGDQSLHLLKYLAANHGRFSLPEYALSWQSAFSNYTGYMDRATRATMQNLMAGDTPDTCGSTSTDLGGAARIAPLIYCYRSDLEGLLATVQEQTALTHRGPGATDAAIFLASSCYAILHGSSPREAFTEALDRSVKDIELNLRLRHCLDLPADSIRQTVKDFGQTCSVAAALPGAIYTVLHAQKNLEEALIETVLAGGDSAARGMVVGMLLGAELGIEKIPSRWLHGLVDYKEIESTLNHLP